MLPRRADAAGKHEVELLGFADGVVRVGIADVVRAAERAELGARVVVELCVCERRASGDDGAHLGENALVVVDGVVWELYCGRLDFLLLLLVVLLGGLSRAPARLTIAGKPCLEDVLDEMVQAQDVAGLGVLDHPVCEAGDVARGLEHGGGGHDGGVELEHMIVDDKVAAPFGDDVGLEGGAGRAVVVQAGDACWGGVSEVERRGATGGGPP